LAKTIKELREEIFTVASRIVAGIDFPEDVAEPEYTYLIENFEKEISQIDKILIGAKSSDILRQGIKVAIVGRPNVGKSSLFNALLNINRAIVTDIAGTTRDVIKENIDMGIPVTLIDTAGIRKDESVDKVEEIGIEYSKQSAQEADLILFMYAANEGFTKEDKEIYEIIKDKKHIILANKIDLGGNKYTPQTIEISTVSNKGLEELKSEIKSMVLDMSSEDIEFVTNKRQQTCLIRCRESLDRALKAAQVNELQDMIYIDLKSALLALDEITGEVITDDILNNIFDHFCIGK
jgi:tRNA modification GTPase